MSTWVFPFGGSTAQAGAAGLVSSTVGVGNGADLTDDQLDLYSIPANAFDASGAVVIIHNNGFFAATANEKKLDFWFGSEHLFGLPATVLNGGFWEFDARIIGSLTDQFYFITLTTTDLSGVSTKLVAINLTHQDGTAPIDVLITGASPVAGAADDVLSRMFIVEFLSSPV